MHFSLKKDLVTFKDFPHLEAQGANQDGVIAGARDLVMRRAKAP
jgi:hypothetical protein